MVKSNEVLDKLPKHLWQYIIEQDYEAYSPIDQAVWRHVMQKNIKNLPKIAHESYLDGLRKSGISANKIPTIYGMNRILKEIGWAAVAVDGFIPPAAFMEFQAYKVLVIATDIRQIDHIEYTPAPDIIHESAGHAPIIANPEYAEYLRRLGEIGCRAISSAKDFELYEAIRHLSIVKEAPNMEAFLIKEAEEKVLELQNNLGEQSEMAKIRNIQWWTVEYGLIGDLKNHKIYGAGLLSSIGESESCLKPNVKKIYYDLSASELSFDITQPQPQLFVTPNFAHLSFVLEQFANNMSLRKGGAKGLEKLIESKQLGTITYNTGLQVSGIFTDIIKNEFNEVIYYKTTGPSALSFHEKELISHGTSYHKDGFGSPVGKLKNINIPIENMSPFDLEAYKILEEQFVKLHFEGNITVEGEIITGIRTVMGKIILISFKNCTVKHGETILFKPEWGIYDMAIGHKITSAFAGAADPNSFQVTGIVAEEKTIKALKSERSIILENLYAEVDELKNSNKNFESRIDEIEKILNKDYPQDWLLKSEIKDLKKSRLIA